MRHSISLFLLAGWLMIAAPGRADNWALIIGAGTYPGLAMANHGQGANLQGPPPDALKLKEVLIAKYAYNPKKVVVLLNAEASKSAIIRNIDLLKNQVQPNDRVLIYFSGHGTSSRDPGGLGIGLDAATGAIVPSDLSLGHPGDNVNVQTRLIVGNVDLRPLLTSLDQKADVLVIFDSCFSGESVKSIGIVDSVASRFVSLADLTDGAVTSRSLIDAEQASHTRAGGGPEYPYHRVVYFSAAAISEKAADLPGSVANERGKFQTIDRQPHGALTNVLLKTLSGDAAGLSCKSLFEAVSRGVEEQDKLISLVFGEPHSQHPQLLAPADTGAVERPCFESPTHAAVPPPPPPPPPPARPRVADPRIRAELDRIARDANGTLDCKADKPSYRSGERTFLRCTAPEHGYINVISYGEGDSTAVLLLPNRRQASNEFPAGEVKIPNGGFNITNVLPRGVDRQEQVMLVLFTEEPLELEILGVPADIFTGLSESAAKSIRSQLVTSYNAVELVFPITR